MKQYNYAAAKKTVPCEYHSTKLLFHFANKSVTNYNFSDISLYAAADRNLMKHCLGNISVSSCRDKRLETIPQGQGTPRQLTQTAYTDSLEAICTHSFSGIFYAAPVHIQTIHC
jgi:hypothetical protein